MNWIFMRELAPCRIKIKSKSQILSPPPCGGGLKIPFGSNLREAKVDASSRIKIQWIEFLCDKI